MSKVDIYSIAGDTSQEAYIALDSDSTQSVSGEHSRNDENKKTKKEQEKKAAQHSLLVSQLAGIDRQLKQLGTFLKDLKAQEQAILDAMEANDAAQNQTQYTIEITQGRLIQNELEIDLQQQAVEQAHMELVEMTEMYEVAAEDTDIALNEEEAAWDAVSIHEDALEQSSIVSIRQNGFERKVVYQDADGYYAIDYYADPNGERSPITNADEIKEIEEQINNGKKLGSDPELNDEEKDLINQHIQLRLEAEGYTSYANDAGARQDEHKQRMVEAGVCVQSAEEALKALEQNQSEIHAEVAALQKRLNTLLEQRRELKENLEQNHAEQERLEQEIAELEAQKADLETQIGEVNDLSEQIAENHMDGGSCMVITTTEGAGQRLSKVFDYHAMGAPEGEDINAETSNETSDVETGELETPELTYNWNEEAMRPKLIALENDIAHSGSTILDWDRISHFAKRNGFSDSELERFQNKIEKTLLNDMPDIRIVDPQNMDYEYVVGDFQPRNSDVTLSAAGMAFNSVNTSAPTVPAPAPVIPAPVPEAPKQPMLRQQFGMA